jgi:hypothetical protein
MAYDPNTTPPPRRTTGPGTWIAVAIAVLIIAALIWWFVAGANDDEAVVDDAAVPEVDPVEEGEDEVLDDEEGDGAYRSHPDRLLVFTIDGVDVVIAA